ncbi:MAG: efflux RND transporter periplasmic adaptor subunit [Sphingobacteriaceae bacterium]
MNKSISTKRILYSIIAIVIVAVVVLKLKKNKAVSKSKVYQYEKGQAINVQADTVQLAYLSTANAYSGTFEPSRETKMSAEIPGKINAVLVDVGTVVNKAQVLIRLDNSLLKLQLKTIEIQIEGLEADVNRYVILAKADAIQGIQLEKATLSLKSAKVQKATLIEQIEKTAIKAPFSGIVTAKLSEEGAFAAPGVPLLQISDIRNLKFTLNVSEMDLNQFKLNQTYHLSADAYPEMSLAGKAIMIGSKANMGSSFTIQFLVKNTSDLKMKSGMFGKVNLTENTQEKGIMISSAVIVGSENQPHVYVVEHGKAILRKIIIYKRIQNKSVVSTGLKTGDVIITNGFINLFDGANVTVK